MELCWESTILLHSSILLCVTTLTVCGRFECRNSVKSVLKSSSFTDMFAKEEVMLVTDI